MFLSCGDSLYDVFINSPDPQSENLSMVDTDIEALGIVGGSPMNVALGMARLEHQSYYLTKISSDVFGKRITQFLNQNSIDTSLSAPTELNTSLAVVETQTDGSADYVFYINGTADVSLDRNELPENLPTDIRIIHFASYSTVLNPTAQSLQLLAEREHTSKFISYDPNLRLSVLPDIKTWSDAYKIFSSHANLVKASTEDITSLFGKNSEEKFVADCIDKGVELVYITRGAEGASAYNAAGKNAHTEGTQVKVTDTVGAGDTFQAAILHWLISNGHITDKSSLNNEVDLQASLDFAVKAAAITCQRRGADLPTLTELSNSIF